MTPLRFHPADHEAEDRQESLRQRFSGPRQEQVRAGAAPPPPPAHAAPAAALTRSRPAGGSWTGSWRPTPGDPPSPWTSRLSAPTARVSESCPLPPARSSPGAPRGLKPSNITGARPENKSLLFGGVNPVLVWIKMQWKWTREAGKNRMRARAAPAPGETRVRWAEKKYLSVQEANLESGCPGFDRVTLIASKPGWEYQLQTW